MALTPGYSMTATNNVAAFKVELIVNVVRGSVYM